MMIKYYFIVLVGQRYGMTLREFNHFMTIVTSKNKKDMIALNGIERHIIIL